MNILIIGNGFDLAHKLPTKYENFLEFVMVYEKYKHILKPGVSIKDEWNKTKGLEQEFLLFLANLCDQKKKIFDEIKEMITDNVWLEHFFSIYEELKIEGKEGWIDFESEISSIIQEFEEIRDILIENLKEEDPDINYGSYRLNKLIGFYIKGREPKTLDDLTKIKDRMLNDLNRLIRALEVYLSTFVNQYPVDVRLPDIEELKINKVLSFNYTNTFERLYGKDNPDIEYDYIHGKADVDHDINSCSLVLGIDEYLPERERDKNTEFIQFKKFFQRIYKKTGSVFFDWAKDFYDEQRNGFYVGESQPQTYNIYIIGHSLDITDKDILKALILMNDNKTTIFHHNQEALGKQIANLVKVIGQDNLIYMVHGSNARVILQQQQDVKNVEAEKKEE